MAKSIIDLHFHSTYSDGILTPYELAELCHKNGVRIASLTDHDSVGGTEEFIYSASKLGIAAIPGVELSSEIFKKEVHILGYGIDIHDTELIRILDLQKKDRLERVPKMVYKLNTLGYDITVEDVMAELTDKNSTLGRPHVADALIRKGFVKNRSEAFKRLLRDGGPAFVDKHKIDYKEAIRVINESGGMAVWAHPGLEELDHEEALKLMIAEGLAGIEAYYGKHTKEQARRFSELASRYGLYITSGSDYHGKENDLRHCFIGSRS